MHRRRCTQNSARFLSYSIKGGNFSLSSHPTFALSNPLPQLFFVPAVCSYRHFVQTPCGSGNREAGRFLSAGILLTRSARYQSRYDCRLIIVQVVHSPCFAVLLLFTRHPPVKVVDHQAVVCSSIQHSTRLIIHMCQTYSNYRYVFCRTL